MTQNARQEDLEFTEHLARIAGENSLRYFNNGTLTVETKADGSRVTVADRETELLIVDAIQERFPNDSILGEEHGGIEGTSGRRWIIDPIDGTDAFTRGVGLYCNLIALEDQTGVATGAINVPAMSELIVAGRGLGAFCNGSTARVSEKSTLDDAVVTTTGFGYWDNAALHNLHSTTAKMRTWGDGYGYLLVATGRVEAMIDPIINYWDVAPVLVVLAEAGGELVGLNGEPWDQHVGSIGTNSIITSELVTTLNA